MEQIKDFNDLVEKLRLEDRKPRVVVPCPDDSHTQQVLERALMENIADVTLVSGGQRSEWVERTAAVFGSRVGLYDTADADAAAALAVKLVRQGEGDVLMKGRLNTDNLLRAVLNKECGLLEPGRVLSHMTLTAIPAYHKLLLFMDAAVIPNPTLEQFEAILSYGIEACRRLGIVKPLVALINCNEKVSDKFPHTRSYEALKHEAAEGRFGSVCVDGPMDVKTACDRESAQIKGIASPVAGNADMLVFPDIQAGNTFYKTVTLFASASTAGMLCGTTKPVVVASRADTTESKFYSLALACVLSSAAGTCN